VTEHLARRSGAGIGTSPNCDLDSGVIFQSLPCADNNRIARATGATIVHRPEEIRESDIGTRAGLFDVRKIGDEFFTFIVDCEVGRPLTVDNSKGWP
jgi:hypothetical protein